VGDVEGEHLDEDEPVLVGAVVDVQLPRAAEDVGPVVDGEHEALDRERQGRDHRPGECEPADGDQAAVGGGASGHALRDQDRHVAGHDHDASGEDGVLEDAGLAVPGAAVDVSPDAVGDEVDRQ
jgi:hypothetical protein